jgi:predicted RNA polymerase sigma factor
MFMSCHPELTPASAISLTVRAVGGLTTAEIANAWVAEPTLRRRGGRVRGRRFLGRED